MRRAGERGKTGDHGQDGAAGATGPTGKTGPAGRAVLTKAQTLALFAFVVLALVLIAYRAETNADNAERQVDRYLEEVCANAPDVAPETCFRQP